MNAGKFKVLMDEPVYWFKFEGAPSKLNPGGKWIRVDETSTGKLATSLRGALSGPNDTTLLFYYLLGAKDDGRILGTAVVNGVQTTRVAVTLDLRAALEVVPAPVRDALVVSVGKILQSGMEPELAAEVWVGDDGLVYRQRLEYSLSAAMGEGHMITATDYAGHGVPLKLAIPEDADVISVDDLPTPSG